MEHQQGVLQKESSESNVYNIKPIRLRRIEGPGETAESSSLGLGSVPMVTPHCPARPFTEPLFFNEWHPRSDQGLPEDGWPHGGRIGPLRGRSKMRCARWSRLFERIVHQIALAFSGKVLHCLTRAWRVQTERVLALLHSWLEAEAMALLRPQEATSGANSAATPHPSSHASAMTLPEQERLQSLSRSGMAPKKGLSSVL